MSTGGACCCSAIAKCSIYSRGAKSPRLSFGLSGQDLDRWV
jgi:hypothetical protein